MGIAISTRHLEWFPQRVRGKSHEWRWAGEALHMEDDTLCREDGAHRKKRKSISRKNILRASISQGKNMSSVWRIQRGDKATHESALLMWVNNVLYKGDKLISSSRCRGTASSNTFKNHLLKFCQIFSRLKTSFWWESNVDFLEVMVVISFFVSLRHEHLKLLIQNNRLRIPGIMLFLTYRKTFLLIIRAILDLTCHFLLRTDD